MLNIYTKNPVCFVWLCARNNSTNLGNERSLTMASSSRNQKVHEPMLTMREYRRILDESSIRTSEEDAESVCTIQCYETELVQDTPDTDTRSEEDFRNDIEYEVASLSEMESIYIPIINSSSSGSEDIVTAAGVIGAVICNSSREAWLTDGEDCDNRSMEEMVPKRKKFWSCIQCKSQNSNPLFRYCQKCFQVRKSFFPPRPRGQRKRKFNKPTVTFDKNSRSNSSSMSHHNSGLGSRQDTIPLDLNNIPNTSKELLTNVNSPGRKRKSSSALYDNESPLPLNKPDMPVEFLNSPASKRKRSSAIRDEEKPSNLKALNKSSSNENSETKETSNSKLTTHTQVNPFDLNLPSTSEKHLNGQSSQREKRKKSISTYDEENHKKVKVEDEIDAFPKCTICNVHERNSIFLHGSIGHMHCCYKCAKHCWNTTKKCPTCNRRVQQVVKVFC